MHIPDGFLSPPVAAATGVVSLAAVSGALRKIHPEAETTLAPRMGLTAAYVFAAQMVNFPVAAGTSGHLLGALLAAVLLGPHAAAVAMTAVFLIQTFFFLDGGHTALGANVLNMGLAGTYGGYAVYQALAGSRPTPGRCAGAAAVAAWVSVMLGATLTSLQLALSGAAAPERVFPAMLGIHAVIGAGEGAITASALLLLWRVRPDLIQTHGAPATPTRRAAWAIAAGLVLVAALAPLASPDPDGLEKVAEHLGFDSVARAPSLPGPVPDYTLPGLEEARWAPAAVSLGGAALMVLAVLPLVRRRRGSVLAAPRPPLSVLDARVKLACTLGLAVTAVLLPPQQAGKILVLAGVAALWAVAARVSVRWLGSRTLLLLPLVGLAVLSLPELRGNGEGPNLSFFTLAFLRAGTSLLATAAFVGATSEPEALAAMSALGMPRSLSLTLAFGLRYLKLLADEAGRMLQARAARCGTGGTLVLRAQSTGGIVGSLFVRSYERAERVSQAMAARGCRGGLPVAGAGPLSRSDWLYLAGFAVLVVGIWLWR